MKKVFLLLIAAVFSLLSANAQKENALVISAGNTKELVLGDNMNVLLVQAGSAQNDVRLDKEVLKNLSVKFYDDVLEIRPERVFKNQTVYIIVNGVQRITVGENTSIQSESVLHNGQLDLYMHVGATANLKTSGRIDAFSLGDFELSVKRTPLYSSISAGLN